MKMNRLIVKLGVAAIALAGYVALPVHADEQIPSAGYYCESHSKVEAKAEKKAPLIEVKVCPVTHTVVHGEGTGSEVVGKYKVYFCCAGCQPAFEKLSEEQKLQKAQAAYKIQQENAVKKK